MTHLFFHGCTTKNSQIYYVWSLLLPWVPDLYFQLSAGYPYLGFPQASHIQHVKNQSHSPASPTCFPTCILSWLMKQLATQLARNHGVLLTHPSLSFLFFYISHQDPSLPSLKCFCVVTSQATGLVQNLTGFHPRCCSSPTAQASVLAFFCMVYPADK